LVWPPGRPLTANRVALVSMCMALPVPKAKLWP
jgi:hypothetical protein